MKARKKIEVKQLKLTAKQLQNARNRALKEFENLVVWRDSSVATKKAVSAKKTAV